MRLGVEWLLVKSSPYRSEVVLFTFLKGNMSANMAVLSFFNPNLRHYESVLYLGGTCH